ncbi:MAG: zinc ABC transporter substrate-binding protein [Marinobacter sp.]|uniref:zinc ABC transporter substrate-binding protein n=1 Tax=Marinobacter sp. TaxID=50741 RepID=UPI00299D1649|nr:zinc ABC transporter substrate-binding protein [Marinobacter sp.]MDX1757155.1 zinc ABC transporter substrate-binding protein [Marinobacter sp.]
MRVSRYFAPLLLTLVALGTHPTASAEPRIVTSLKPLELLVRAIAPENAEITSLVPAGASPHTYQMRPSQRRALADADLIFWVGPEMETFLERLLLGSDFREQQVALMPAVKSPGTQMDEHQPRHDHHQDEPDHLGHDGHAEHEEHGAAHHHGEGEDPHIWLDPELALTMARAIQQELSELPGVRPAVVAANLQRFEQELRDAEAEIRKRLAPARSISLFTYHDAFRRFAEHYGLEIQGVLTLDPERSPGARHIAELQQKLKSRDNVCLLTEPQFNRQWWRSITEGIELTISTWDPLASEIEANAGGYVRFQQAMAEALLACLPEQSQH